MRNLVPIQGKKQLIDTGMEEAQMLTLVDKDFKQLL